MEVVKGNKKVNINSQELLDLTGRFERVIVDLGTGDGRFVYKNAFANPKNLYIGIDPSEKQLKVSSRDISRKKLDNALLVIGSAEYLPEELKGIADKIYVNFPWGSLLEIFVKPNEQGIRNIMEMLKPSGVLKTVFGYDSELEPSETKRLNLPNIDLDYLTNTLVPKYKELGLNISEFGQFDTTAEISDTTWSKRLKTSDRSWFFLVITK